MPQAKKKVVQPMARKAKKSRNTRKPKQVARTKTTITNVPIAQGFSQTGASNSGKSYTESGSCILRDVPIIVPQVPGGSPIEPGTTNGTLLFAERISASSFEGSGLEKFSDVFENYWFDRLAVTVDSRIPTTLGGGYILAFFDDPETQLAESPTELKRQCMNASKWVTGNWWNTRTATHQFRGGKRGSRALGLKTNPSDKVRENEPYFVFQGLLALVATGDVSGAPPTSRFTVAVSVDYTVRFWDRINRYSDFESSDVVMKIVRSDENTLAIAPLDGTLGVIPSLPQNERTVVDYELTALQQSMRPTAEGVYVLASPLPAELFSTAQPGVFMFLEPVGTAGEGDIKFASTIDGAQSSTGMPGKAVPANFFGAGMEQLVAHFLPRTSTPTVVDFRKRLARMRV